MLGEQKPATRPVSALPSQAMLFKPVLVGGQDITSLRAVFDETADNIHGKNIVVASENQLLYFDLETCRQNGVANIAASKIERTECVVAMEKIESSLRLFTNFGKIFIWDLDTRDWINELNLPFDPAKERLISCKMIGRRQYLFTLRENAAGSIKLYYSMARSERERPKHRELINDCGDGSHLSFDVGCSVDANELDEGSKTMRDKQRKQRLLTFINKSTIFFQRIGLGEKLEINLSRQTIANHDFTCVRANPKRPMIAAGDSLGRIYIYSGGFRTSPPWSNRTKLHWHHTVSDLCFSSTGQTLYSVGMESGCVVIWELSENNLGRKQVISNLGLPIRHISTSDHMQKLILSFENNEIQVLDTDFHSIHIKTLTRRTYDMYIKNDVKALRNDRQNENNEDSINRSVGLLWHPKTDTLVTNSQTGRLQFYSPKNRMRIDTLDCLRTNILCLEEHGKVVPSEITKAAFSVDGDWLAFYETREFGNLFPEVKLHIWQRSNTLDRWFWIQTADRLHSSANIADLKFSPDGQYLVSVGDDGTFNVLHRVCLDARSASKQIYAKGFFGNVPEKMASLAAFSQDSSVLAISLKNGSTLIWMIVDPYKLEYECQLNNPTRPVPVDIELASGTGVIDTVNCQALGLHFGQHRGSIAPLCEVRSRYIRIWNILNAQSNSDEMMEYLSTNSSNVNNDNPDDIGEFTAAAFCQTLVDDQNFDHFAVSTTKNSVLIFELKINQTSRILQPLAVIDSSLSYYNPKYTHMNFLNSSILDIDNQCHSDTLLLRLINRLCLMTDRQELVAFTDRLTFERQLAVNNCNAINESYEMKEILSYFSEKTSIYLDEVKNLPTINGFDPQLFTEKQKMIKQKLEVQKVLKNLFERIPSHNLPRIDVLGPMIIDKLIVNINE